MELLNYYNDAGNACAAGGSFSLWIFNAEELWLASSRWLNEFATDSKFWYPLIMNTIAAYIFYWFFTVLPFKRTKRTILPLMDYDLYCLHNKLFFFFEVIMQQKPDYTIGHYQKYVTGGLLTEEMIRMGLQNKCLNSKILRNGYRAVPLIPIGEHLTQIIEEAELLIDKASGYDKFILPKERALLERIRTAMRQHDLLRDTTHDVIANCADSCLVFYPLYSLFVELQDLVLSRPQVPREWHILKANALYHGKEYKQCLDFCKRARKHHPKDDRYFSALILGCLFNLGKKDKFHKALSASILDGKLHDPMSNRGLLGELVGDGKAMAILKDGYGEEVVLKALGELERENHHINMFEQRSRELDKYFKDYLANYFSKTPRQVNI